MAQPLYDFPEPSQRSQEKGPERGQGSQRSMSVLDRLLLTGPVWLQLSISAATALHILQREPPGTFLVRRSHTSQRNVLCVRLADQSVPSFVQQFGIREEPSSKTLCLETSAVSFPDLSRLISFYCASRDVLPFTLELPEAISKASSRKELESISHMGIEFWKSHLNIRGPRDAPKPIQTELKKPEDILIVKSSTTPDSDTQVKATPDSIPTTTTTTTQQPGPPPTLLDEFCPIPTRSPSELNLLWSGSGLGALCFVNPLFLQAQSALCRRRMFKRSLKVRCSTESSTMLSPPLVPPPPPPLMPKAQKKSKCEEAKAEGSADGGSQSQATQVDCTVQEKQIHPLENRVQKPGQDAADKLPAVMEHIIEDSDYMHPSSAISLTPSPSLSPYLCPSGPSVAPPLLPPKVSSQHLFNPLDSLVDSPASLSPYQSPSLSPRAPFSLSPYASPRSSPPISPPISPSRSPKTPTPSLSPFNFCELGQEERAAYDAPATVSRPAEGEDEDEKN